MKGGNLKTKAKKRNLLARDLILDRKYRPKTIKDKTKYSRKGRKVSLRDHLIRIINYQGIAQW